MLAGAREALQNGLVVSSGVMARAALEGHLRDLYRYYVCTVVPRRYTAKDLVGQLSRARQVDKSTQKAVKAAIANGNRCAHNAPVDYFEVVILIEEVQCFLAVHAAKDVDEDLTKLLGDDEEGGTARAIRNMS